MRNTFIVSYDICNDKHPAKVLKTMRGFGDHRQYSVYAEYFRGFAAAASLKLTA